MARHKGSLVFHRAGQYQTWPDAQPPRWTNRLTPRKNALSWPPRCHVQTLFVPGQKRKRATTSLSTHANLCFRSNYASPYLSLSSLSFARPCPSSSFRSRCCFRRSVFIARALSSSFRLFFMQPLMMNSRRGNDWRVEQRFCYVRIAILLENFSLSSPIRLNFLGFNHPWKMLKLNSSLELKFGIGYYLETHAKFLINCKCRLYMIQNLLLILLS